MLPELIVVVPSRGRPKQVAELHKAILETSTRDTWLMVSTDNDDPTHTSYPRGVDRYLPIHRSNSNMVEALNSAALVAATDPDVFAVAFMGDDHRPRTVGWDAKYLDALHELGSGIVYGNDLIQGSALPTQCAMTADIIRTLGFMAPPSLNHLWVDNFWLELGKAANCIKYLNDVVVEHRHPVAGKAQWDANYKRVNSQEMIDHDQAAFTEYADTQFALDVEKVRRLRESS